MKYELPARSNIEFINLKVSDLNQMVDFYTKVIGLYLFNRNEFVAYLGMPTNKRIFISLKRVDNPSRDKHVANLKSFTLILPSQQSFKKSLVYIRNLGIKVPYIQTNGVWDKFTLTDPENNRVSLRFRKARPSITLFKMPLTFKNIDSKTYLGNFNSKRNKLPESTKLGWLQLSVENLKQSLGFYHKQLGLDYHLNQNKHQAMILNKRTHHREFILKEYPHIHKRNIDTLGLNYMNTRMTNPRDIANLAEHLKKSKVQFTYNRQNNFVFVSDPNEINLTFSLL